MTKNNGLIQWGNVIDNHILGLTPLGKIFIRTNRDGKVTGMYTMFGEVEKFVPQDESQEKIDSAKEIMSKIVQNKIERDIFLKKDLKL